MILSWTPYHHLWAGEVKKLCMRTFLKWTVFCITNHEILCYKFWLSCMVHWKLSILSNQVLEDGKEAGKCLVWLIYHLICADYWRVPEVPYRPSYWKILWWLYKSQNKAWSLFQGGSEFLFYGSQFLFGLCLYFVIPLYKDHSKFWQKAIKRKANFEQSKELKERLKALRKETAEVSTEENNFVQS